MGGVGRVRTAIEGDTIIAPVLEVALRRQFFLCQFCIVFPLRLFLHRGPHLEHMALFRGIRFPDLIGMAGLRGRKGDGIRTLELAIGQLAAHGIVSERRLYIVLQAEGFAEERLFRQSDVQGTVHFTRYGYHLPCHGIISADGYFPVACGKHGVPRGRRLIQPIDAARDKGCDISARCFAAAPGDRHNAVRTALSAPDLKFILTFHHSGKGKDSVLYRNLLFGKDRVPVGIQHRISIVISLDQVLGHLQFQALANPGNILDFA